MLLGPVALLGFALLAACWAPGPARAQEDPPLSKQRIELTTGIDMAYAETGPPAGEPGIFLRGFTDTSRSFWPTIQHLAGLRPDLRLIALDQRGHGDSSMPDPAACRAAPERCFRMVDFASDVIAFMDEKGIEQLLGPSINKRAESNGRAVDVAPASGGASDVTPAESPGA